MSPQSHNEIDYELLGRYFAGEASPAEAIAVEEWQAASPNNRQLLERMHFVWNELAQQEHCILPAQTAFFEQIKNHATQLPAIPVRTTKNRRLYAAVAASLLLLSGAALWFMLLHSNSKLNKQIAYITHATQQQVLHDTLPDNTIVILNSYSQIQYPTQLAGATRNLLLQGEAWFNVTPNTAKPFIITTGPIRIKVVGTSFNVRNDTQTTEVAVKTGVVRMISNTDSITIHPGQKGVYNAAQQRLFIATTYNINEMAYATRIFNFENATLKQIAGELEKAYDLQVVIENKKLESCTVSSSFDNKSIEYIFDVLAITLNIHYRIVNKTVYISGNSCT